MSYNIKNICLQVYIFTHIEIFVYRGAYLQGSINGGASDETEERMWEDMYTKIFIHMFSFIF